MKKILLILQICIACVFAEKGYLGLKFEIQDSRFVITEVKENSAAQEAGVPVLQEIIRINGDSIIGKSEDDIMSKLKGSVGDSITLSLEGVLNKDEGLKDYTLVYKRKPVEKAAIKKELSKSEKLQKQFRSNQRDVIKKRKTGYLGFSFKTGYSGLTLTTVESNSPARKIGLQKGDLILKIYDISTAGLRKKEAHFYLAGNAGDTVSLLIADGKTMQEHAIKVIYGSRKQFESRPFNRNEAIGLQGIYGIRMLQFDNSNFDQVGTIPLMGGGIRLPFDDLLFVGLTGRLGGGSDQNNSWDDDGDDFFKDDGYYGYSEATLFVGTVELNVGADVFLGKRFFITAGGGLNWLGYTLDGTNYDETNSSFGYGFFAGAGFSLRQVMLMCELTFYKNDLTFQTERSNEFSPGVNFKAAF